MESSFAVSRTDLADAVMLTLTGPLDAFTAVTCDQILAGILAAMPPGATLIIDLRPLDFIGAAGVRTLFGTVAAAQRCSVTLQIVLGTDQYARAVIGRIDGEGRIPIVDNLDEFVVTRDAQQ